MSNKAPFFLYAFFLSLGLSIIIEVSVWLGTYPESLLPFASAIGAGEARFAITEDILEKKKNLWDSVCTRWWYTRNLDGKKDFDEGAYRFLWIEIYLFFWQGCRHGSGINERVITWRREDLVCRWYYQATQWLSFSMRTAHSRNPFDCCMLPKL